MSHCNMSESIAGASLVVCRWTLVYSPSSEAASVPNLIGHTLNFSGNIYAYIDTNLADINNNAGSGPDRGAGLPVLHQKPSLRASGNCSPSVRTVRHWGKPTLAVP